MTQGHIENTFNNTHPPATDAVEDGAALFILCSSKGQRRAEKVQALPVFRQRPSLSNPAPPLPPSPSQFLPLHIQWSTPELGSPSVFHHPTASCPVRLGTPLPPIPSPFLQSHLSLRKYNAHRSRGLPGFRWEG